MGGLLELHRRQRTRECSSVISQPPNELAVLHLPFNLVLGFVDGELAKGSSRTLLRDLGGNPRPNSDAGFHQDGVIHENKASEGGRIMPRSILR